MMLFMLPLTGSRPTNKASRPSMSSPITTAP
ncbi:Uncharacterised protein [Bordetella pertussis]|nr:Uncharacterised protein [Bordetella pertussis]